jgi:hypothetical protein
MKLRHLSDDMMAFITVKELHKGCGDGLGLLKKRLRAKQRQASRSNKQRFGIEAAILQRILSVNKEEARALNIAYGLIRGRQYYEVEVFAKTEPLWEAVFDILFTFGYDVQVETDIGTQDLDTYMKELSIVNGRLSLGVWGGPAQVVPRFLLNQPNELPDTLFTAYLASEEREVAQAS